ncbi:apyrase-like, partial [Hyposmocoma kahamanoa]|uniref:apyrase-like n=1 Tax=Hyposmocoma kahamanoa TaxID=1477025 RepID=UPI000E6D9BFB
FSAPIGRVIMEDELEAINREAAILTEQGVDIIILLSHVGYTSDMRLAQSVSRDVDIIVGAHSHTLLYTGEAPDGNIPLGEYPTVVTRDDGHRIPIVQASCYTRYLGIIKLYINEAGIIESWEGQPVYLGSSIVQDPYIMELLEPWRHEIDAIGREVLGSSLVALNRDSCNRGECNIGSWACDGFLEEVMLMEPRQAPRWHNAHVCMMYAGGLRAHIEPGNITTEDLLRTIPFEDYMQIYELKGKYLLEALEFSVGGNVGSSPDQFNSGQMLQIGGMRNIYNVTQPSNSRVTATVRCIDCDVPRYLPLDENATYTVVTSNFIGDGGGGYTMLSENRENVVNLKVDYQMLQDYMRRR